MEQQKITTEDIVMELVVNSGAARSLAMAAIDEAAQGNLNVAREQLAEAREQISKAHVFQSNLIAWETEGCKQDMSLIMVHGQDHLMTAMVVIDLAEKFINLYENTKLN